VKASSVRVGTALARWQPPWRRGYHCDGQGGLFQGVSCDNETVAVSGTRFSLSLLDSSLAVVTQTFQIKALSTWLVWISWIAPAALCAQTPADLKAEVAARRIDVASRQVERIKALVDTGVEARIRLDAAERDLEDTKDKVILESAAPPLLSGEAGPSDDAIVEAAQRRLDRQKAWTEKIRTLIESGIPPPSDLIPTETELHSRESDLASAQARIFAKAEAVASVARGSHDHAAIPPDFEIGKMEHFEGLGTFDETRDLQAIEKAFEAQFDRPLPISADGETEVHRALGFDHRGRIDVAVDPRAPEGIWLRRYLRSQKIPYYAFTSAVAGKATAAHIHIGPGSSRLPRPASKA
jgi:hypothetical protein